jgi:hypothetical protein
MNENNKIPLPGEQQPAPTVPDLLKERGWFGTSTEGLLLDFAKPYTPPKWTLKHNGISFAKRGDLHIVGGKAGHGKTAFMSQIMATLLNGQFGNMTCQIEGNPSILYIDTEQSEDDTIAIKNRVCTLSGIDYRVPQPRFKVARLRDVTDTQLRYKQILQLMWEIKPDVVFIDGLLDIVNDYNNQTECSDLIRELMAVSTAMNMSMWCVLHENPMTDKLVGSLGSIAERKVTEVFVIRKHKGPHSEKRFKDFPTVFFEVKQTKARGKDQEDWYFTVEDRALGWGVPVELGAINEEQATKFDPRVLKEWITKRQYDVEWPATRTDINSSIFKPEGVTDEGDQKDAMKACINSRFFLEQSKDEMKPGQKVPRLKINEELILPM